VVCAPHKIEMLQYMLQSHDLNELQKFGKKSLIL